LPWQVRATIGLSAPLPAAILYATEEALTVAPQETISAQITTAAFMAVRINGYTLAHVPYATAIGSIKVAIRVDVTIKCTRQSHAIPTTANQPRLGALIIAFAQTPVQNACRDPLLYAITMIQTLTQTTTATMYVKVQVTPEEAVFGIIIVMREPAGIRVIATMMVHLAETRATRARIMSVQAASAHIPLTAIAQSALV
jgi:hypothetical protein